MDPFTLQLLLAGGGALASLFGGKKEPSLGKLDEMFGANSIGDKQKQLFSILASSPAFRSSLSRTNVASQNLGQRIDSNLARSGIGGSGVGAVGGAIGASAGGFAIEDLISKLSQGSLEGAMDINKLLANLWQNSRSQEKPPLQQLGGSILGALGPQFLQHRPAGTANSAFHTPGGNPNLFF